MSDALVRAAFETRLLAWANAQVPAIPVAFENQVFTPPSGRYAACFLLPAPTQSDTLNGEHRRRMGVFQVSLYMPIGTGPGAATALASSLDAAFPQLMRQGSILVTLLSPMSATSAVPGGDRYMVPVSCTYRSDTV